LIFPFLFNLSGFVFNFLGWGCVIFTENIPLCYCLQSVLLKTWIFSVTKDNNGVQIFPIYPNNNSMSAISRENVQIILISEIKVYIKVQLVLSVWKKTSLSKSGYWEASRPVWCELLSTKPQYISAFLKVEPQFKQTNKQTNSCRQFQKTFVQCTNSTPVLMCQGRLLGGCSPVLQLQFIFWPVPLLVYIIES
jgi:hypothetical protein